jgi:5-amino-6-(5-phosphoribosylamino)uracil reductase/diaminohydroxyphosphoribosylaminopyrimidine deaminase/5-amino-6-(5-phosphoribosylamino)uracil reductase
MARDVRATAAMASSVADRQATMPTVTIHYAQTLDGRIAARDGTSRWISGEESLRFAHELRAAHDAVMVGVGTVIADDPRLTVRLVAGRSPLRVVVDSALRVPLGAQIASDGAAPSLVATTFGADPARAAALAERRVEVLRVDADEAGRVDLASLLRELARRGVASVLIEGGRSLITSALRDRVVDRLVVCIAPKILGSGVDAVGDLGASCLGDALTFARVETWRCGVDLIVDGSLQRVAAHV